MTDTTTTEKLGDKLVKYKAITSKQLEYALKVCKETNELLGMVLINQGIISQETLIKVIHLSGKRSRLGEILIREGVITNDDLQEALEQQKNSDKFLGEILIKKKKISAKDYLKALSRNMNMPIKRLKGFIPKTSLNEIVLEKVSILCDCVVYNDFPGLLELVVAQPYEDLFSDLRILIPDRKIKVYMTYPQELNEAIRAFSKLGTTTAVRYHTSYDRIDEPEIKSDDLKQVAALATNEILSKASRVGASDIHIMATETGGKIKIRKDGKLQDLHVSFDLKQHYGMLISRIKILTNSMDITEKRVPQDGSFKATFKDGIAEHDIDFRVATILGGYGEGVTIRILDQNQKKTDLDSLGFSGRVMERYKHLLDNTEGMIIITGPTGSGKTSTLYATINALIEKFPGKKIMTAEDPIEFRYDGDDVSQSQLLRARGLGFAELLRSFLRHDPDIMLVGEIRDQETAETAIKCVQTGHLLLTTLHTPNATATIERLKFLGVNPAEFMSATKGIIGQRLIPRICPDCAVKHNPGEEKKLNFFGTIPTKDISFYHGKGCSECQMSGYSGRTPLVELWIPDDEERIRMHELALPSAIRRNAIEKGLHTFYGDGVLKLNNKLTTLKQLIENIPHRTEDRDFYQEQPNLLPIKMPAVKKKKRAKRKTKK